MELSKIIIPTLSLCTGFLVITCGTSEKPPPPTDNQEETTKKPNIILIQTDDLGYDDLGIHGNRILETPNIDSFARGAVQFSQYYVNPVSAPTRASLLTGRHFLRTGVSHVHGGKDFLNLDEITIAQVFKKNGYVTGMWGKWHSGHAAGYYPWERGFDQAYMAKLYVHRNSEGQLNGKYVKHKEWADKVITDYAIKFIDKNKDKPFFAYLSYLTCHSPLDAPDKLIKKYKDKGLSDALATLYAMIDHLDLHLKRLFVKVQQLGIAENTIILFMSDNGPAIENGTLTDADRKIRYVNQLTGHKGNIWENGVKSPLFIQYGDNYKPCKVNQLVDITDILPTLMDIANLQPIERMKPLDGQSFQSYLKGDTINAYDKLSFNYAGAGWPPTDAPWTPEGVKDEYRPVTPEKKQEMAYTEQIISVREQRYKLLIHPGKTQNSVEPVNNMVLVDIMNDPREQINLADSMPEKTGEMKQLLEQWFESVIAEKGSFAMPVFRISENDSTIKAKAPFKISDNLKNTFNALSNWTKQGDFAEYTIDVHSAGDYSVVLEYATPEISHAIMQASVNEQTTSNTLDNKSTENLGTLQLKKGKNKLRIELIKHGNTGIAIAKLENIYLIKK